MVYIWVGDKARMMRCFLLIITVLSALAQSGYAQVPATPVWISVAEIQALPTSGAAWTSMLAISNSTWEAPDMGDPDGQNSNADVQALAGAYTCVANSTNCAKTVTQLVDAAATTCSDWLTVGRNLTAYTIAADVLRRSGDLTGANLTTVESWLQNYLDGTTQCDDNVTALPTTMQAAVWIDASNADTQIAAAYAALALYFDDSAAQAFIWKRFRLFVCDLYVQGQFTNAQDMADEVGQDEIPVTQGVNNEWTHDDSVPCGINPAGATRVVSGGNPGAGEEHSIDGATPNDIRRGGVYQWPPINPFTTAGALYPWTGFEGLIPATVIIDRMGHASWYAGGNAVCRAIHYMYYLNVDIEGEVTTCTTGDSCWWDFNRCEDCKHLAHLACGHATNYNSATHSDHDSADGLDRTFGYTDWTHPTYSPLSLETPDTLSGFTLSGGVCIGACP